MQFYIKLLIIAINKQTIFLSKHSTEEDFLENLLASIFFLLLIARIIAGFVRSAGPHEKLMELILLAEVESKYSNNFYKKDMKFIKINRKFLFEILLE